MATTNPSVFEQLQQMFHRRFDLSPDQASPGEIDQALRTGVPFRGTNLWLLIFAIFIASIGLNVNSTAVIIGAMLVSPLMGPIMGIGYGAGVGDFELLRTAFKNLGVATLLSLLTSTLYFWLTPLTEASSELLARTSPTLWDVLIALFGGLAGIIGSTRKEKSNVIPGVAIATALMPPLCTCGFGLATGQPYVFLGAFYLFSINSVFIATATLAMVRIMRLPELRVVDKRTQSRTSRTIVVIVAMTTLPSIYLAAGLVRNELFLARAENFIAAGLPMVPGRVLVRKELDAGTRQIRLTLVGEPLSEEERLTLDLGLVRAGLEGVQLQVHEAEQESIDVEALRSVVVGDLQRQTLAVLEEKSRRISELERALEKQLRHHQELGRVSEEMRAAFPQVLRVSVGRGVDGSQQDDPGDLVMAVVDLVEPWSVKDLERAKAWMKVRLATERILVSTQIVPKSEVEQE